MAGDERLERVPSGLLRNWLPLMKKGCGEAMCIALLAAIPAAALYCYGRVSPKPAKVASAAPVADANTLWIDARPETEYAKGHIPGALSLNEHNWDNGLVRLFETWQPPRRIVVYCSAGCSDSAKVATRLRELGIEPVEVIQEGFEGWKTRTRKLALQN